MARPHRIVVCLSLAIAVLAVYAPVVGFEFVAYDDPEYVTSNPHVLGGITLEGLAWAWRDVSSANWHPLTWVSHMLDVELFGSWAGGHHLTSVGLHAANAVLLFLVLAAATGAHGPSAFVAGLFALHPLHVESVAWVSERKDVLSTTCGLLAIGCYVGFVRQRRRVLFAAAIGFMALGLLAKSMLVTLPALLLLLDRWPLDRGWTRRGLLEKLPFFALSAVFSAVALATQRSAGAMDRAEALGLGPRIANAGVSYLAYLGDALWPVGLAVQVPHPYLPQTGGVPLAAWQIGGAAVLLVAISVFVLWSRRPYLVTGWLWYLIALTPVIGLVQVGMQGRADRYTYLPLVGIFIALAWGAAEAGRWLAARTTRPHPRRIGAVLGAGALLACAALSFVQAGTWRDSHALFGHALARFPRSAVLHLAMGQVSFREGDAVRAEAHYREAVERAPEFADAHTNLAEVLLARGRSEEAVAHYRLALDRRPERLEERVNFANALQRAGRSGEAIAHYRVALERAPASAEAHFNLANAHLAQRQLADAEAHYREALRLSPGMATAHFNLGFLLSTQGRLDEATRAYERALEARPDYPRAALALRQTLAHRAERSR